MINDMMLERTDGMYWARYEAAERKWEAYIERKAEDLRYEHFDCYEVLGKIENCKMYCIHADGCIYVALENENGVAVYEYYNKIIELDFEEAFDEAVWAIKEYGDLEDWIERIEDFDEEYKFDKEFEEYYEPVWCLDSKTVQDFLNICENAEIVAVRANAIF